MRAWIVLHSKGYKNLSPSYDQFAKRSGLFKKYAEIGFVITDYLGQISGANWQGIMYRCQNAAAAQFI